MAGGATIRPGQAQTEMNLVPMIDVMLVLLIIYMVLAMQVRQAIPVQVPPLAAETPPSAWTHQLVLELTGEGGFSRNGMPIPDADLDATLSSIFHARPTKLLFVKPAGNRSYQEVIRAMDRARGVGVTVVALMPRG